MIRGSIVVYGAQNDYCAEFVVPDGTLPDSVWPAYLEPALKRAQGQLLEHEGETITTYQAPGEDVA